MAVLEARYDPATLDNENIYFQNEIVVAKFP